MLAMQEVDNRLANMVNERVKPEADKTWDDIIAQTGLN
jgi:hypothetical protein